ncbi:hypothetical protein GCM10009654_37670 [Streptomyces hebeiensis]|uniref:Uncharacterized protein n=1 Tax=Streptomyces hebeiensis TaxID=229486 RepID=A0ABN1UWW9_9ACTN
MDPPIFEARFASGGASAPSAHSPADGGTPDARLGAYFSAGPVGPVVPDVFCCSASCRLAAVA